MRKQHELLGDAQNEYFLAAMPCFLASVQLYIDFLGSTRVILCEYITSMSVVNSFSRLLSTPVNLNLTLLAGLAKTNKLYYIIHRSSESYLKFIRILIFIGHVPALTVICVLAIDLLSILKSIDSIPILFNIRLNISTSSKSLSWKNVGIQDSSESM